MGHRHRRRLLERQKELINFIARRLLATIPVLLIVAVLVFLMLRLTPGDPAAILAGDAASTEQITAIRASLGLDRPLPVQFAIWLGNLARGELGQSYFYKMQVTQLIGQRLEPTMALATLTILFAVVVSIPLGVLAAWRFGGWFDRALMGFSVLGFSVPVFVLAYILIWIVSLQLGWFPVQGYRRLADGFFPFLHHLILPALTLSVIYIALIARVTRASVLEALGEDYIRTARAKGLPELRVLVRHALANAAVPIATVIGIGIAILIGGVVVTESVYAIPGLGRLTVDAVLARDFPTIQGVILFFSFIYVLVNLVIDLSYVFLDPRIRY
jgi:peptide/nickel transport system permease protein